MFWEHALSFALCWGLTECSLFWDCMLYILTSKWVLRTAFAGQNMQFWLFCHFHIFLHIFSSKNKQKRVTNGKNFLLPHAGLALKKVIKNTVLHAWRVVGGGGGHSGEGGGKKFPVWYYLKTLCIGASCKNHWDNAAIIHQLLWFLHYMWMNILTIREPSRT